MNDQARCRAFTFRVLDLTWRPLRATAISITTQFTVCLKPRALLSEQALSSDPDVASFSDEDCAVLRARNRHDLQRTSTSQQTSGRIERANLFRFAVFVNQRRSERGAIDVGRVLQPELTTAPRSKNSGKCNTWNTQQATQQRTETSSSYAPNESMF